MNAAKPLSVVVLFAGFFGVQSCVTDNPASYQDILGRSVRDETKPSSGGTGAGGTGGLETGGSAMTGGTASSASGGDGGMGEGGEPGGSTGGSGAGTAGTGTVNPPPHPDFMPPCFLGPTTAGEEILKGTVCTADDPQLCYRPCGPQQVGWKTERCMAGVYAEGDCSFPLDGDYACFKIPETIDVAACGLTAPPAATDECSAEPCTVCNFEDSYQDTGGDLKIGYCVCRDPDPQGVRRWTCASDIAWPCPANRGC